MSYSEPARTAARRTRSTSLAALVVAVAAAAWAASWLVKGKSQSAAASGATAALGTFGWPGAGVSAAKVTGGPLRLGPGAHRPVPIASVAKVMTAYLILRDHPLSADASGPQIVVEPSEAAAYPTEVHAGESVVPVQTGEVLTERQALEALLLPSADNVAWILARWDAGSLGAFVDRMNEVARELGMSSTHYTDPSGLAASTTSSAADQVRLGMAAMRQPALAEIASQSRAVIPVAGTVENLNKLLGEDGIVGLKTGSTSAAGGCVLLVARSNTGRRRPLIVAAVFGQPGSPDTIISAALQAGHQLVLEIERNIGVPPASAVASGPAREIGGQRRPRGEAPPQPPGQRQAKTGSPM
jgi:serine-type D-Ala-D-Ala carboxypeptidase (penicillin-binding protein 5/6)